MLRVKLRRQQGGVSQTMGQQGVAAAVDGLRHADAKKIVMRGDGENVAAPEPGGVVVKIFCVANAQDAVCQSFPRRVKFGGMVAKVFAQNNYLKIQPAFCQRVKRVKKVGGVLVVFPAMIP